MSVRYSFGEEEIFAFSRLNDASSEGIFKASVLLYRRISGNEKQKSLLYQKTYRKYSASIINK